VRELPRSWWRGVRWIGREGRTAEEPFGRIVLKTDLNEVYTLDLYEGEGIVCRGVSIFRLRLPRKTASPVLNKCSLPRSPWRSRSLRLPTYGLWSGSPSWSSTKVVVYEGMACLTRRCPTIGSMWTWRQFPVPGRKRKNYGPA
jgi:hypothetical protein